MKANSNFMAMLLLGGLSAGSFCASAGAYAPINATYTGLFYETNHQWQQSAGLITITTTSRSRYSAKLQLGTTAYRFSGPLDANGMAVKDIVRRDDYPLTVQFQVSDQDSDLVAGWVSQGTNWNAALFADRAIFDGKNTSTSDAGQYTMIVPGDYRSTNNPGGSSIGTITIGKAGRISFAGTLADGTKVTQGTRVAKGGEWPLYLPLYGGEGALYQWMYFNSSPTNELNGTLTWVKPETALAWYYPWGFAIEATAYGSRYTRPPAGSKVLDLSTAAFEVNGGNLDWSFTNHVALDSKNHLSNTRSANPVNFSVTVANGSFSGRVRHPITWDWITFRGVVLQSYGIAAGHFLGWDQSGEVWLEGE